MRPRGTIVSRGKAFSVVIDRGKDPVTGRRHRDWYSGFDNRKQAERARTKLLREFDTGSYVDPLKQTLGHYLREEWLPSRKPKSRRAARGHRGQVSLTTWTYLRDQLEAYVIPRIGHIAVQDLTAGALDSLYDELEERGRRDGSGLASGTVLNVHRTMHKALKDAVRRGKVAANVADAVDAPKATRQRPDVWSVQELRVFLDHVRDHRVYPAWLLFVTTGMRRGEVAGLAREDLDLDRGSLRVDWTLGMVDGKLTWKSRPKSRAGQRVIALDPATVEALRAHLAVHAEHRLVLGERWPGRQHDWRGEYRDDSVFTWPDGRVISPDRYTEWFARACRAADLRRIRLHDVRHTYATVGLRNASGWHEVKVLSQRLGHASIGFTLDTYAHVLPAADEQAAHTLARHILDKEDPS